MASEKYLRQRIAEAENWARINVAARIIEECEVRRLESVIERIRVAGESGLPNALKLAHGIAEQEYYSKRRRRMEESK